MRQLALPIQELLEEMLGILIPIRCVIDNTQAIQAIKKGYSRKLRCLNRTHRCSIGVMNEIYNDPEVAVSVEYGETKQHKGDFFTKALLAGPYELARARVGLQKIQGSRSPVASAADWEDEKK